MKLDKSLKTPLLETLQCILIGLFIFILCFPENDWIYSSGGDESLVWLYNYIFDNGLNIGKNIIFPHGILAFFMYPLAENVVLVLVFTLLLQLLLVFNISRLNPNPNESKWIKTFAFSYFIAILSGFNQLIITNIIILFCNYFTHQQRVYKLLAFVLTAFAFYGRSYMAIIAMTFCAGFFLYYLIFKSKTYKTNLYDGFILIGLLLVFWWIMYGTLSGFIDYVIGIYHLAQDNSSAVSYYPYNNWLILSFFLILLFGFPLFYKTEKSIFYGMLVTLSLFAVWKHNMARVNTFYAYGLLNYLLIIFAIYFLVETRHYYKKLILFIVMILLFIINITNYTDYSPIHYEPFKVKNFVEFITQFPELKEKAKRKIHESNLGIQVPQSVRDSIGQSKVDIYPWNYAIIPANGLNWQARPLLQSYASYTHWLDKKNATHWASVQAPHYLIWELDKISESKQQQLNSIDYRYLLNDEPQSILQMLKNYTHYYTDEQFLILKKRRFPLKTSELCLKKDRLVWGQWLNVPQHSGDLLRAKLFFEKSLIEKVKSFFYKDEQFWIYLKEAKGRIHSYRIVPENAKDGIWIQPYLYNRKQVFDIEQIMFVCSARKILNPNLRIEWEQIKFENQNHCISDFFKIQPENDSLVFKRQASTLQEITFHLDSLPLGNYQIYTNFWLKVPNYQYNKKVSMILSIENENGNVIWEGNSIDEQLIDNEQWNSISSSRQYEHKWSGCVLKIYLLNQDKIKLQIKDFRLLFFSKIKPRKF